MRSLSAAGEWLVFRILNSPCFCTHARPDKTRPDYVGAQLTSRLNYPLHGSQLVTATTGPLAGLARRYDSLRMTVRRIRTLADTKAWLNCRKLIVNYGQRLWLKVVSLSQETRAEALATLTSSPPLRERVIVAWMGSAASSDCRLVESDGLPVEKSMRKSRHTRYA